MADIVYAGNQQDSGVATLGTNNTGFEQQLNSFRGTPMQIAFARAVLLNTEDGQAYIIGRKAQQIQDLSMAKSMFNQDVNAVNAFDELTKDVLAIGK